jgi:hypothetical protein
LEKAATGVLRTRVVTEVIDVPSDARAGRRFRIGTT